MAKYYESSYSSRSSNGSDKIYTDVRRRGMFSQSLYTRTKGLVTNEEFVDPKDAPPRKSTPKRPVEIHHHNTPSTDPKRPNHTADDRWR